MKNFERIKQMNKDEMAKFLTKLHCQECCYQDDLLECNQVDCWCHKNDGYRDYGDYLLQEVEE